MGGLQVGNEVRAVRKGCRAQMTAVRPRGGGRGRGGGGGRRRLPAPNDDHVGPRRRHDAVAAKRRPAAAREQHLWVGAAARRLR